MLKVTKSWCDFRHYLIL